MSLPIPRALAPTAFAADDSEVVQLRAENAALNEQIKLLVKTEQRLYRSQKAREHELRRIHAVGAFALEVVGKPVDAILDRTLAVLHECFELDAAAVLTVGDAGRVSIRGNGVSTTIPVPRGAWSLLAATTTTTITALDPPAPGPAPGVRELLATLGFPLAGRWALIPLGGGHIAVAQALVRKRPVHGAEPLAEAHLPLVALISTHVQRVIEHVAMTEDLQRRSEALAVANGRLADSMATLERTQAQLIQAGKMEAIGRMAGGVAHDFNNLLTVILTHATLALEELPPGTPSAVELEGVLEAGKRAADITTQLLALGRKTVQKRVYVDVGQVARDLGRVLRGLLGRTVALDVTIEPDCGVFVDRAQLQQVVLNLVINARDAMPTGGTVRVAVRSAGPAELVHVEPAVRAQPWVVLEVGDTGVGIDEATQLHIFEPFFTTKESGQGTGLGLSVVYGVVAQSEGVIAVESQPGVGTRFVVLLPRRSTPTAPPVSRIPRPAAGARVLVVEDNEAIRRLSVRILERAGYTVLEAGDGVAALELLGARPIALDLVVTDLNMPRMGGFELARRLEVVAPGTPILFMTGYSDELAEASRLAPGVACMTKPFTPAQLLDRVGQQLAAPKPA